jgi:hypothetical protein
MRPAKIIQALAFVLRECLAASQGATSAADRLNICLLSDRGRMEAKTQLAICESIFQIAN